MQVKASSITKALRARTLNEIASLLGGQTVGDANFIITGACGLQEAAEGDIAFLSHARYLPLLKKSSAGAVIIGLDCDYREKPVIIVEDPAKAFLRVLAIWAEDERADRKTGIDPAAAVADSAEVHPLAYVGPKAVIGEGAFVDAGTDILAGAVIGDRCRVGRDSVISENAVVRHGCRIGNRVILHAGAVIGADGFGYECIDGRHVKVPQTGDVWIQDDVEIGANACVDRARFGTTLVKRGTKIDNLVQIAHNVTIGEDCLVISLVGISGSTEVGDRVILAGQVGVTGHIKIGSDAKIGAQSGVYTHVPEKSILLGTPPRPIRQEKELILLTSRLPQLFKDVKEIKKKIQGS